MELSLDSPQSERKKAAAAAPDADDDAAGGGKASTSAPAASSAAKQPTAALEEVSVTLPVRKRFWLSFNRFESVDTHTAVP